VTALPEWADRWVLGRCGCGARIVQVDCYCGSELACSRSGWSPEKCAESQRAQSGANPADRPDLLRPKSVES